MVSAEDMYVQVGLVFIKKTSTFWEDIFNVFDKVLQPKLIQALEPLGMHV